MAWSGDDESFQGFIGKHGLTFPQISDPSGEVFSRFGVAGQPAFAVVGTDGEVELLLGAVDDELLDQIVGGVVTG